MFNIMSTLYLGIPIQDAETIADWQSTNKWMFLFLTFASSHKYLNTNPQIFS